MTDKPATDTPLQPDALVWLPAGEYGSVKDIWNDQFIWCPIPVDNSLPVHQASFIGIDEKEGRSRDSSVSSRPSGPPSRKSSYVDERGRRKSLQNAPRLSQSTERLLKQAHERRKEIASKQIGQQDNVQDKTKTPRRPVKTKQMHSFHLLRRRKSDKTSVPETILQSPSTSISAKSSQRPPSIISEEICHSPPPYTPTTHIREDSDYQQPRVVDVPTSPDGHGMQHAQPAESSSVPPRPSTPVPTQERLSISAECPTTSPRKSKPQSPKVEHVNVEALPMSAHAKKEPKKPAQKQPKQVQARERKSMPRRKSGTQPALKPVREINVGPVYDVPTNRGPTKMKVSPVSKNKSQGNMYLSLNLDLDVQLKMKLHGNLTLSLFE